ncbi:MAG: pilus (MSHA type) biogenesis protein MshL, partial [Nitrospirae bacterium]
TFHLDYLNARRSGSSTLTISSGTGGAEGDGSGSAEAGAGAGSTEIRREVSVDLWAAVEQGLAALVKREAEAGAQVVVNREAGTILVTAGPRLMRRVEAYLRALEAATERQVMIEAKIVEVELNRNHRLGVDWAAVASAAGGFSGNLTGGAADLLAHPPLLAQGLGGEETAFRFGATSHDLSVVLDALESQGRVRVVSSPRIAAVSNQPAVIKVAQEQTFFSVDRQTNVQAGLQQDTFTVDKEKYTIGVVLDLLPRIADDGSVVMAVHPSVTDFAGEEVFPPGAKGAEVLANAPLLKVRELDTVVRLRDGETLVIAGLIRQEERNQVDKVPLLGDLPLVGGLFRRTRHDRASSELVIFLTPHRLAPAQVAGGPEGAEGPLSLEEGG